MLKTWGNLMTSPRRTWRWCHPALRGGQDARLHFLISFPYIVCMNSKQRKTLEAIFRDPVSGTIEWAAIESLLVAVGARVIEGSGSRARFEKDGEIETFHRPHPAKEPKRYQVRAARAYLVRLGVEP